MKFSIPPEQVHARELHGEESKSFISNNAKYRGKTSLELRNVVNVHSRRNWIQRSKLIENTRKRSSKRYFLWSSMFVIFRQIKYPTKLVPRKLTTFSFLFSFFLSFASFCTVIEPRCVISRFLGIFKGDYEGVFKKNVHFKLFRLPRFTRCGLFLSRSTVTLVYPATVLSEVTRARQLSG